MKFSSELASRTLATWPVITANVIPGRTNTLVSR
jgi:hypothetical protein